MMRVNREPSDVQVTLDPRMLSWAVCSASLMTLEFDPTLRRLRLEQDLPWGVPLRFTIGRDRIMIEAEAGEDLGLTHGVLPPSGKEQPLLLRYTIPATVSGMPEGQTSETWVLPADLLRETLYTATEKNAQKWGDFWREVIERDVTLRMSSPNRLLAEYTAEGGREDPGFSPSMSQMREEKELAVATDRFLIASTPGRKDYYCPVLGVERNNHHQAELSPMKIVGEPLKLDLKRHLALGDAALGGDGVLVDMDEGRLVAPTRTGIFAANIGRPRDLPSGSVRDLPSDTDLALALNQSLGRVRSEIKTRGRRILNQAAQAGDPDAAERLLFEGLDPEVRSLVSEQLTGGVEASGNRLGERLLDRARPEWADVIGRAHLERDAIKHGGLSRTLRTVAESRRSAVVSPRMMFASAAAALSADERYGKAVVVNEVMRRSRVLHVSAAAAASEAVPALKEDLVRSYGTQLVAKARSASRDTRGVLANIPEIDEVGLREVYTRVLEWGRETGRLDVIETHSSILRPELGGDRTREVIAAAIHLTKETVERELESVLAGAIGCAVVNSAVRAKHPVHPEEDITPGELPIDGYAFASAYLECVGKRSAFELDVRHMLSQFSQHARVPGDLGERVRESLAFANRGETAPWVEWSGRFQQYLESTDRFGENLPLLEAIRRSWADESERMLRQSEGQTLSALIRDGEMDPYLLDGAAHTLFPNQSTLDFPYTNDVYLGGRFKAGRDGINFPLDARRRVTAGRVAVDDDGCVFYSASSPDGRWGVTISDRAREPRPDVFAREHGLARVGAHDPVASILQGDDDLGRFHVPSADLIRIANLLVDVGDSRNQLPRVVVVARWAGLDSGVEEPAVDAVLRDHTKTVEGYPLPRTTIPDHSEAGGTLRFYAVGDHGIDMVDIPVLRVEGVQIPSAQMRGRALTSVIDALDLQDLAGYAAEAGDVVPVALRPDGSLAFRASGAKIAAQARVATLDQVPAQYRIAASLLSDNWMERAERVEWHTAKQIAAAGLVPLIEPVVASEEATPEPEIFVGDLFASNTWISHEEIDSVLSEPEQMEEVSIADEYTLSEQSDQQSLLLLVRDSRVDQGLASFDRLVQRTLGILDSDARAKFERSVRKLRDEMEVAIEMEELHLEKMRVLGQFYERLLGRVGRATKPVVEKAQELQGGLFDPPAQTDHPSRQDPRHLSFR